MKQIKFFRERDIIKESQLMEIIKALQIEKFNINEEIFEYGDLGDKFYIILEGSVSVLIPFYVDVKREEKEQRKNIVNNEKNLIR